jgi:hypothetical protein
MLGAATVDEIDFRESEDILQIFGRAIRMKSASIDKNIPR